jgi:ParB family transcriptional regulator, chromosome partitioning protein
MAGSNKLKEGLGKRRDPLASTKAALSVIGTPREELEKVAENLPIEEIAISALKDNPYQHLARPKVDQTALEELADSIKENGFFGALLARKKPGEDGVYELAYGHRRRDAAKLVGLTTLPVKVLELPENSMARIMASENFSREDLSRNGEANVIGHLYTTQNLSFEDLAKIVGKKRGWIQLRMSLYQSSPKIKEMVELNPDTLGHIRILNQIEDEEQKNALIDEVIQYNLTRERLEERIAELKNTSNIVKDSTSVLQYADSENSHNQNAVSTDANPGNKGKENVKPEAEVLEVSASKNAWLACIN